MVTMAIVWLSTRQLAMRGDNGDFQFFIGQKDFLSIQQFYELHNKLH